MRYAIGVHHLGGLITCQCQQITMRIKVRQCEFRHSRLALPQEFTGPTQFKVAFGDHKPVICLTHYLKAFCGCARQGG